MPDYDRKYLLMAAVLAPAAGISVVAGFVILLFGPVQRIMTGLFYVLLVGAPIAYGLEFLGIWYFRERLKGGSLRLPILLPISAVLGVMTPVVPIYGFHLVQPTISWILIATLGALGGVVSAVTFWLLAPTPHPAS